MRYLTIGNDPARQRRVSQIALGAMLMGTATDEATSYAILDRYVEAGGTFVDTANNYAFWVNGTQGGESEQLLGRWLRSRGIADELTIATKVGGRPPQPANALSEHLEGLSAQVIKESLARSLENLGRDHVDVYYAHVPDPAVPLEEQVETFGALAADGTIGLLGLSNYWSWQIERARAMAAAAGLPGCEVLQHHHTYFRARTDQGGLRSRDGSIGVTDGQLLSYLRQEPGLTLVAYTPLLSGGYVRADRPLDELYDHAGTKARKIALDDVVQQTGATANQVVLSWLMGGDIPIIPLVGASSVAQLDETLAAADLELTPEQRDRLNAAGQN
ncbi:aryl-alcohol dehydrogenase-like predicted oxidoreductase [Kribbella rubisoli]|uniref:Aryl-alcohol dehydrogenase-like predicted oxidoreductase n=1 Tax=Kribbella rubisoli TaxID=3075929 RepID=A0A4Q7XK97_9ACTN|nr:aldo/keto reductase [Kribbella rubisoli]RZU24267.1 aryl-alcohol dehydrogenase-like predicted oxidoreductase [Kribbella rubisoli]